MTWLKLQEVHALAAVGQHPNVVQYYTAWMEQDAAIDGEHLYIQLEACDTSLGNLRALKTETKDAALLEILRQVMLCYLSCHVATGLCMNTMNLSCIPDTRQIQAP